MTQAILLADLGFGDAGKGTITDFLARELGAHTIVRYNGGPQAAHNVVTSSGMQHTFAQFGSAMLLPLTKTLLSRFMLISPLNMFKEERHLSTLGITNAWQRTFIDRRALVITPFQRALNRLREIARAGQRHGSCGEGVGECMADFLHYGNALLLAGDLENRATILKKLHFLRDLKRQELDELRPHLPGTGQVKQECSLFTDPAILADCADVYHYFAGCVTLVDEAQISALFAYPGPLIFEGAQGILLDENFGFTPYTTWSTTTFANAETLLHEHDYAGDVIKLGIVRSYATRHGAGPFPTEDKALTRSLPDQHNTWNNWQQAFRVGHFDLLTARYACEVAGKLDYLAITHLDRLASLPSQQIATAYRYGGAPAELATHFAHRGERITKIRANQSANLAYQEELTRKLFKCTPEYYELLPAAPGQSPRKNCATFLSLLEEQLGTPIAITSTGPTAADKQWHLPRHLLQPLSAKKLKVVSKPEMLTTLSRN
ncbi:adenylosuccinate synthetase [Ktedonosporobacter rubrisoli]|nr:adenylosuccinate synthetase [Ktedonosporobacter rubrisoli]